MMPVRRGSTRRQRSWLEARGRRAFLLGRGAACAAFAGTFLTGLLSTPAGATPCAAAIGSCDYYQCLEREVQACGRRGYALGYVKPYCERFVAVDFPEPASAWSDAIFPDDGNAWRDGVLACLQRSMDGFVDEAQNPDCQDIQDFGFASHPICYTAGPSFCAITPQNVFRVGLTIGLPQLLKPLFWEQVRATSRICVEQLSARIEAEERPWARQQLGAYLRLWQSVVNEPRLVGGP